MVRSDTTKPRDAGSEMAQLTTDFFQKILAIEGGYQNHPDDTGNYCNGQLIGTKFGMSAIAVGTWWGRCPSVQEMKDLTTADAQDFYAWYFDRYSLFQIQNQKFFELLANNTMGSPANAAKVAQRALNQIGFKVDVDGIFGPQTIDALNEAWQRYGAKAYNLIRKAWIEYLESLNRPQFIEGWLYRMNRYFPPIGVAGSIGFTITALTVIWIILKNKRA